MMKKSLLISEIDFFSEKGTTEFRIIMTIVADLGAFDQPK